LKSTPPPPRVTTCALLYRPFRHPPPPLFRIVSEVSVFFIGAQVPCLLPPPPPPHSFSSLPLFLPFPFAPGLPHFLSFQRLATPHLPAWLRCQILAPPFLLLWNNLRDFPSEWIPVPFFFAPLYIGLFLPGQLWSPSRLAFGFLKKPKFGAPPPPPFHFPPCPS